MSNAILSSVAAVISALGGPSEAARWAGYDAPSGVCNWLTRGIPPSYHMRLTLEGKRRGFVVDPEVYGLDDDDAAVYRAVFEHHAT